VAFGSKWHEICGGYVRGLHAGDPSTMSIKEEKRDSENNEIVTRDFDLVKYFSVACLILFVVVTTLMCTAFYYISKQYIRRDSEHHAIPIANWLARNAFVEDQQFPVLGTSEFIRLDREMRDVLQPLQIFKIKIYNPETRIIYTTDRQIKYGTLDPDNAKLMSALEGNVVSSLQTEASVWDLDEEERREGAIVEAYVPVRNHSGMIVGVMEIYQDVTSTYARLPTLIAIIVGASVLAMGSLYGILFLIVRRAHNVIRAQTETIRRSKADLESYATELERRVEERTRQLRESLVQQQQDEKMVATGTLAAGVAHELNTPLGTILGSVQMILEQCSRVTAQASGELDVVKLQEDCRTSIEDLARIESQAKRCRGIVGNLVDFSRKSNSERAWESLEDLIEQSISLIQPNARQRGVLVNMELGDHLPQVLVSGNEIQQVLVNLVNNGIDAMPDGGVVSLRLRRQADVAVIEISDTGVGMDDVTIQRIFEPFYTSKEVGRGTGLGLAISYRIVKDHGGRISVSSVLGQGSTFIVELPIHGEPGKDDATSAEGRVSDPPQDHG
jgi:signal transduction histidine kinase